MDQYLIEFCAPTLASIKPGSLFAYSYDSPEELSRQLDRQNCQLRVMGLYVTTLRVHNGRALIYIYRKSQMEQTLNRPEVRDFLSQYGYVFTEAETAIDHLRQRVQFSDSFPHEIGIFLGYPLEDVMGFIEHHGKDCICTGYWKVYSDEQRARKTFSQFRKCQDVYRRLWRQGRSVRQLTVSLA